MTGVGDAGKRYIRKAVIADGDDAKQRTIAKLPEGFTETGNGACTCNLQGNAARYQHHAERGDEWR